MLNGQKLEKLKNGRDASALAAIVKAKESSQEYWKQDADLISLSRTGAGFYLGRRCEVGQLVSMMMAMPPSLRRYDYNKEFYRIWGLVQFCSRLTSDELDRYHIGVAFIGRDVPPTYHENPLQSYRIAGMSEDGLWRVTEAKTSFVKRKEFRHWISLDVVLTGVDKDWRPITDEKAATVNVSPGGATVLTSLTAGIGDSVQFECRAHNFSAAAVVRNFHVSDEERTRLNLQFIDAKFPVRQLLGPVEEPSAD